MAEKIYTAQEAANILKIKKNTVYDMVKRGTLSATKMGKQLRITEKAINEVLNTPTATENPNILISDLPISKKIGTNNIVVSGQDIVLDMLCSNASVQIQNSAFVRSYDGCYNSLCSMYKDEITVASVHLWDRISNTYNIPFVSTLLPGEDISMYHILKRPVGFYVAKGNPKNIQSISDYSRNDISIVNREKGSGIRILTDSLLYKYNIKKESINGYNRIVNSHLSAAAIVSKSGADCAIGSKNNAIQFQNLDFVFLQEEEYDIVIKTADLQIPQVQAMINVLQSEAFREEIDSMGWYDTSNMGKQIL